MARPKTDRTKAISIFLHPKMAGWLNWQATMDSMTNSEIVEKALRAVHAECLKSNPDTPPVD